MENSRSKILIFIDWYLPGYKAGGPVTSMANMVEHLKHWFQFYIITRNTEYMESKPYSDVNTNCWNEIDSGVFVYYCSEPAISFRKWAELIQERDYTKIYINGIYSWKFSILPLLVARLMKMKNVIVAPRGMLASSAIAIKGGKKRLFLKLMHLLSLYKYVSWHTTNPKEADEVRKQLKVKSEIVIASNLSRKIADHFQPLEKQTNELKICSLARVAPEKNTLFAVQCLMNIPPHIKLEFNIYGQIYNQEYWTQCQKTIEILPANIKVHHQGTIPPHEVPAILMDHHLLFLPSRGENFGHVIMESFMVGRPVLISDQTPWRNLERQQAGWDLSLSDPSSSTKVLTQMGEMEQSEFDRWCNGSFQLALKYNDSSLIEKYMMMFGN